MKLFRFAAFTYNIGTHACYYAKLPLSDRCFFIAFFISYVVPSPHLFVKTGRRANRTIRTRDGIKFLHRFRLLKYLISSFFFFFAAAIIIIRTSRCD